MEGGEEAACVIFTEEPDERLISRSFVLVKNQNKNEKKAVRLSPFNHSAHKKTYSAHIMCNAVNLY